MSPRVSRVISDVKIVNLTKRKLTATRVPRRKPGKKGAARERWISSFVLLRDRKPGIERMRECEKKKERELKYFCENNFH